MLGSYGDLISDPVFHECVAIAHRQGPGRKKASPQSLWFNGLFQWRESCFTALAMLNSHKRMAFLARGSSVWDLAQHSHVFFSQFR